MTASSWSVLTSRYYGRAGARSYSPVSPPLSLPPADPLPAVALSTDSSVLTCIANDYDYDTVFARQVEAYAKTGDVLWAFSTSGASPNILKAAEAARSKGAQVIAFTGRLDSPLEQLADVCFCADAKLTARSQEIHQLAYHIICDLVERSFCG